MNHEGEDDMPQECYYGRGWICCGFVVFYGCGLFCTSNNWCLSFDPVCAPKDPWRFPPRWLVFAVKIQRNKATKQSKNRYPTIGAR